MRWLRRRRLLREAEALEREARRLRRSLFRRMGAVYGPLVAIGASVRLAAMQVYGSSDVRAVGAAVQSAMHNTENERADELEARAKALREEAGRG